MTPKNSARLLCPKIPEGYRDIGRMLISCPDCPGIVAAVSRFLYEHGANITHSDQHSTDPTGGTFFMRIEFQLAGLESKGEKIEMDFALVDVVVLARYMQILTPYFISNYPYRIINIHHSFLPAFAGADPYAQGFERGVKLIGATAHYVTEELDAGPIIE